MPTFPSDAPKKRVLKTFERLGFRTIVPADRRLLSAAAAGCGRLRVGGRPPGTRTHGCTS